VRGKGRLGALQDVDLTSLDVYLTDVGWGMLNAEGVERDARNAPLTTLVNDCIPMRVPSGRHSKANRAGTREQSLSLYVDRPRKTVDSQVPLYAPRVLLVRLEHEYLSASPSGTTGIETHAATDVVERDPRLERAIQHRLYLGLIDSIPHGMFPARVNVEDQALAETASDTEKAVKTARHNRVAKTPQERS